MALDSLTANQYANLNLVFVKTADTANYMTSIALDRYNNGSAVVHDIDTYVTTGRLPDASA